MNVMLRKFKSFLKMKEQYGLGNATELLLFHLGLKKQFLFNYPVISLTIEINKGPLGFWKLLEQGNWEIELIKFSTDLIKHGETIFDVGAWIGPLTLLFSHLVGKNGRVYAFEPMPKSLSLLEHSIKNNDVNNVELHNMAISNIVNYVTLRSPSPISTMATILEPYSLENKKGSEYKVQCKCTTIDEFCSNQNIEPNGIKIDVEGAEGYVLEGAIKTIEKYHPWCLLEFHGQLISESERKRVWSFITDRTRKIRYIEGDEKDLTYKMQVPHNFEPTKRANYCVYF